MNSASVVSGRWTPPPWYNPTPYSVRVRPDLTHTWSATTRRHYRAERKERKERKERRALMGQRFTLAQVHNKVDHVFVMGNTPIEDIGYEYVERQHWNGSIVQMEADEAHEVFLKLSNGPYIRAANWVEMNRRLRRWGMRLVATGTCTLNVEWIATHKGQTGRWEMPWEYTSTDPHPGRLGVKTPWEPRVPGVPGSQPGSQP